MEPNNSRLCFALLRRAQEAWTRWAEMPMPASVQTEGNLAYGELWCNSRPNDPRIPAAKERLGRLRARLWHERYDERVEGSPEQAERQVWEKAREEYEQAIAEYLDAVGGRVQVREEVAL
jgi:hypothetical protein